MANDCPDPAGVRAAQKTGRVDVSEPVSISSGIAGRYATAVFELAREANVEVASIDLYRAVWGPTLHAPGLPFFSEATGGPIFSKIRTPRGPSASCARRLRPRQTSLASRRL